MSNADNLIKIARTWIGVPWKPSGSYRSGANCVGLLIGIVREAGFEDIANAVVADAGFAVPPEPGIMLKRMKEYLQVVLVEEIVPGDIVVFRINQEPQHAAIVTEPGIILHADRQAKKVVEHRLLSSWRPVAAFRLKEFNVQELDK